MDLSRQIFAVDVCFNGSLYPACTHPSRFRNFKFFKCKGSSFSIMPNPPQVRRTSFNAKVRNGASSIWYGFPNEKENHLLIIEQWPSLETHHQFLHSKEFVGAANILESLLTGPIAQQYHVHDPCNVSHIFSCPLVEFAWFKVKWDKIYEYNIHNEKMSHITKNLPAFINGCGIYKLEDPWMHGLIAGWKFQEVILYVQVS